MNLRSTAPFACTLLVLTAIPWFAADPTRWGGMIVLSIIATAGLAWCWRKNQLTMPIVLGGAVLLRLAYLPLEPVLSDDVYRYLWDARIWLEAGANPYAHPPDTESLRAWRENWLYPNLNSHEYHSVYPPLSQFFFAIAYAIGGASATSYYVLKGLFVAVELGGLWALRHHVAPRHLMLYAWHPLALIEVAGQGHTEALAVGAVGVAFWAAWTHRAHLSAATIAFAGLAKLYPWIALAWILRRFGWKPLLTALAIIGLAFAPFWYPALLTDVSQSLRLYVQLFEFNAGPYYAVKESLYALTGSDWSKIIGPVFGTLTLLGLAAWTLRDWWRPVSLPVFLAGGLAIYLGLATTVHPWYWLVIGLAAVLHPVSRWAWVWIATFSLGTYLFYIDGPYWIWVALGWGGALVLLGIGWIQQGGLAVPRARQKARCFADPLRRLARTENPTLLDIGCAEGALGAHIQRKYGIQVTLTDLSDARHADIDLPFQRCTSHRLPFDDNAFDAALLTFVLHHADDPERTLREALRVSRSRVLILESVAYHPLQRRLLGWADALVNALRSGGSMSAPHPEVYRSTTDWAEWINAHGGTVMSASTVDGILHPWAVLVVEPASIQRESAASDTSSG